MVLCNNAFAVKNVSHEDVYPQLNSVYVIHPGEIVDLLERGIPLNKITANETIFVQFSRGRLIQIQIPDKNNLSLPALNRTLEETGYSYTQYETEQLIRGCDLGGTLGPFAPLGIGLTRVSAIIGNGSSIRFRVTHNLNTEAVVVQTYSNIPQKTLFSLELIVLMRTKLN